MEMSGMDKPRVTAKAEAALAQWPNSKRPGTLQNTCTDLLGRVEPQAGPALGRPGHEALPVGTSPGAYLGLVFFVREGICGRYLWKGRVSWGVSGVASRCVPWISRQQQLLEMGAERSACGSQVEGIHGRPFV